MKRYTRTQVLDTRQDVVLVVLVCRHFALPRSDANMGLVNAQTGWLRGVRIALDVYLNITSKSYHRKHISKSSTEFYFIYL